MSLHAAQCAYSVSQLYTSESNVAQAVNASREHERAVSTPEVGSSARVLVVQRSPGCACPAFRPGLKRKPDFKHKHCDPPQGGRPALGKQQSREPNRTCTTIFIQASTTSRYAWGCPIMHKLFCERQQFGDTACSARVPAGLLIHACDGLS